MNKLVALFIEVAVMFGIYTLASALTWPLRRHCEEEKPEAAGFLSSLTNLFGFISRPLAVLAVTGAAVWILRNVFHWTTPYPEHLVAWMYFWELALGIIFIEGVTFQFYRLRGKMLPVPDLLRHIIRGGLLIAAGFLVLHIKLGIDITPLLGASALVTAVVGFALQGVLGNLLAGMSLHLVRSVVPSDWVAVGDVEGEVIQTNWRETRLRTIAGHMVVVPNSTVAAVTIHNMSRPTPLRRHQINVSASYSDAPGDVIDALVQSALVVPEVLREPVPSAFLTEYKDFGINYALRFWTNRYFDRTGVEGNIMRIIWYRFKRSGIEIPFPMSDKLLNDFMEVVYHQRHMPPEEVNVQRTVKDLLQSDFASRLLVDEKGTPLLKESDVAGLAKLVRRIRFTKGETIFSQGEPGDSCYAVVWGKVNGRVEYEDVARANEFELGPGSLFGEMSLVTGLPRTATVLANEEVELLEISKETFIALLGLRDDMPQILSKLVAERAEENRAMLERLKAVEGAHVSESIQSGSILKRFLHMLGRKW
jgi:small-conductance mechanosensitive channel/CRP-like cAMP-binding protein